jgi:LmbE family N-acetylglucosaminyl deacetylase
MSWRADGGERWNEFSRRLQSGPPGTDLRLLFLAAHPDDETIGASFLLSRFHNSSVVFVTDGAPRDTNLWSAGVNGSRAEYARTRREESELALAHAGIGTSQIYWLDAVDQEAIFELSNLTVRFTKLLSELRPNAVVTHPYEGGHPDHDSAALVASQAIASLTEERAPLLLEMTSYHARRGRCVTGEFLERGVSPELCFKLSDSDRDRKSRMVKAYVSQSLVLQNFPTDRELLRLAPAYDFTRAPHDGKLWYECMGWPMTGARWRELAATAVTQMQEHSCP